jgi:hypothetical protein
MTILAVLLAAFFAFQTKTASECDEIKSELP